MSPSPLHAIIVEPEALIALDIERILRSMSGWEFEIETVSCPDTAPRFCDLLLCSVEQLDATSRECAKDAATHGAAVVLLTTSDELMAADLPWPRVPKPFLSEDIVGAVVGALANRSSPQLAAERLSTADEVSSGP